MNTEFKQRIIIAILAGFFVILAAYISKSDNRKSTPMVQGGNAYAISNGGNSSAVSNSNVSIINNRTSANTSGVVFGNVNQNVEQNYSSSSGE